MSKTKVKKIIIIICLSVGAVALIMTIINYCRFISANKHCRELINLIDEVESPYCKFEFDEAYVDDGVLRIEYNYKVKTSGISDANIINAFNSIRTEVNNYILQNEDFHYRDTPILLEFDTPHGNDDDAYYRFSFANYNEYSDEITTTLDDVRTFADTKTSDLQGIYGLRSIETIVSSYVTVDSCLVFENNPDLTYCKVDFKDSEQNEAEIEKLLPDCKLAVND